MRTLKTFLVLCLGLLVGTINVSGQSDTLKKKSFTITGYVDLYFSYNFRQPRNHTAPDFIINYNRNNEVNVNLALVKFAYQTDQVRANIGIGAGTYMNANYQQEPGTLKNIYEANAGVKLSNNLWLDVGILPSHIGFESAVGKECSTVTRSIISDNTPFYETGIRLTHDTRDGKWLFAALLLNGWQRITTVNGNSFVSAGAQVQFKPSPATTLNYSLFAGTDFADTVRVIRYFHDLYYLVRLNKKLALSLAMDIGFQQKEKGSNTYHVLYAPLLITTYTLNDKISISARGEYYLDDHNILIKSNNNIGFRCFGLSGNFDYLPLSNCLLRIEVKNYNSRQAILQADNRFFKSNCFLTGALQVSF
jgi:hypothetical protein